MTLAVLYFFVYNYIMLETTVLTPQTPLCNDGLLYQYCYLMNVFSLVNVIYIILLPFISQCH